MNITQGCYKDLNLCPFQFQVRGCVSHLPSPLPRLFNSEKLDFCLPNVFSQLTEPTLQIT